MARGGFLGRIGRVIGRIVESVRPAPPPREEPPPQEPPKPPPRRNPYRDKWRELKTSRRGNFDKNYRVFSRLVDPVVEDDDEKQEYWESYIRNIVNGEGNKRRNSTQNMFWRDTGIDPSDFNWAVWREAMGYTGHSHGGVARGAAWFRKHS